jgi:hypothetical protein
MPIAGSDSGAEMDRIDTFPLVAGVMGVLLPPVLLWQGEPTGWCLLLASAGMVLLATYWLTAHHIEFDPFTRRQVGMTAVGVACVWVAVIYLSRGADDLPLLFPGHSAHSEHYRLLPGAMVMFVGVVLLTRAFVHARPARSR